MASPSCGECRRLGASMLDADQARPASAAMAQWQAMALPLPPLLLAASLLIVFGAGIVRGFAGFGFSALSVAGLALLIAPARVVPPIFMLEVLASFTLLRSAAPDIDWRWLGWLVAGN